jgi:hypothetical protein
MRQSIIILFIIVSWEGDDVLGSHAGARLPGRPAVEDDEEIDIVGVDDASRTIVFGACKWSRQPVLAALRVKARSVDWESGGRREYFVLFSRSGFEPEFVQAARRGEVTLLSDGVMVR